MPSKLQQTWSPQQLVHMLSNTQARDKDGWKQTPLVASSTKDIGPQDRDSIVIWLSQVNSQFNFHPETYFLAINILDSFLTCVKAKPKYLRCIAISCFYLASKVAEEEDVIPCTGELVEDSECGCKVADILRMEKIILEKLGWDVCSATSLDYLHIFIVLGCYHMSDLSSNISMTHRAHILTQQLTYLMCLYDMALFPSACLSLALLSIDLEILSQEGGRWTAITGQLQAMAKIKTDDLMKCREKILTIFDGLSEHGYISMMTESLKQSSPPHPTNVTPTTDIDMGDSPSDGYDTDNTLTASEGEEDPGKPPITPPPTYAEIVKSGRSNVNGGAGSKISDFDARSPKSCSAQATYYTPTYNNELLGCNERFKLQTVE